ncbi:MAG: glycosyltransferase [Bacteroidaceae bacterium]|nr:glycosyltransferase [Bacteroidaceae bacterium]
MNKKKICWITPDCFADCDIPYVPLLLERYTICWVVLLPVKARYKEDDFRKIEKEHCNLKIEVIHSTIRERNPYKLFEYLKINSIICRENPNVVYINTAPHTPYILPVFLRLPKSKTIVAAHQGEIRYGFRFKLMLKIFRKIAYKNIKYANLFSESEANRYHILHPHVHIFQFVLGLKDLGKPTNERPLVDNHTPIKFMSFGAIVRAKNIDLLIDAACKLYEDGYKNFKVSINGKCDEWDYYKTHIKYPEIFETDIRMIPNEDIPNLFNGSHYFVQPYKQVTQSGPMKLAFRYNLPDICSDLPGLKSEIVEGVNGYIFKHENVDDLVRVMKKCIDTHIAQYEDMRVRMAEYTDKNYSYKAMVDNYTKMFEAVIEQNN